jgi:hypothetical protein
MQHQVEWEEFKAFVSAHNLQEYIKYYEYADKYFLYAVDKYFYIRCVIRSNVDSTEKTDFETNYKANCNKPIDTAFHLPGKYKTAFEGFSGVGIKNTTTNIDYKITGNKRMAGLKVFLKNQQWGDTVALQLIDKDNILGYGAEFVLREFASNWNIDTQNEAQNIEFTGYLSDILNGFYLRAIYTSVGTTDDVLVKVNLYLHEES